MLNSSLPASGVVTLRAKGMTKVILGHCSDTGALSAAGSSSPIGANFLHAQICSNSLRSLECFFAASLLDESTNHMELSLLFVALLPGASGNLGIACVCWRFQGALS